MVKNPPANAGDKGLIPAWSGKIPHAAEQLSPCATTTEPVLYNPCATTTEASEPQLPKPACLEPVLRNKRSHHNEKPAHSNKDPMQPKINK